MSNRLVFTEFEEGTSKVVGENVFFDNLPHDCLVFLLYYPGAMPNEDIENKLRNLGNIAGNNLFVNIGKLNDPSYRKVRNKFTITNLPVIIITAIDTLSSPPGELSTAYVRIDNQRLLNSPNLIECIQRLFNLFIDRKILEALSQFKKDQRDLFISHLKNIVTNALKGTIEFVGERDISVSLIEGKFEIKKSGG